MARFNLVHMSPRLLPVVLEQQLVPGTFEYALHALIDSEFDLSGLAAKFKNDETGGAGLRSGGDAQDCAACLFARHGEQPGD